MLQCKCEQSNFIHIFQNRLSCVIEFKTYTFTTSDIVNLVLRWMNVVMTCRTKTRTVVEMMV